MFGASCVCYRGVNAAAAGGAFDAGGHAEVWYVCADFSLMPFVMITIINLSRLYIDEFVICSRKLWHIYSGRSFQ